MTKDSGLPRAIIRSRMLQAIRWLAVARSQLFPRSCVGTGSGTGEVLRVLCVLEADTAAGGATPAPIQANEHRPTKGDHRAESRFRSRDESRIEGVEIVAVGYGVHLLREEPEALDGRLGTVPRRIRRSRQFKPIEAASATNPLTATAPSTSVGSQSSPVSLSK